MVKQTPQRHLRIKDVNILLNYIPTANFAYILLELRQKKCVCERMLISHILNVSLMQFVNSQPLSQFYTEGEVRQTV